MADDVGLKTDDGGMECSWSAAAAVRISGPSVYRTCILPVGIAGALQEDYALIVGIIIYNQSSIYKHSNIH